jgi:hypothetical protein
MNTDKIKMQIFRRHYCDTTAMVPVPIPKRREGISVPRYQGTGHWTDVPIYPTSGQKQNCPLLYASHLRPSTVKTAVSEVLLAKPF